MWDLCRKSYVTHRCPCPWVWQLLCSGRLWGRCCIVLYRLPVFSVSNGKVVLVDAMWWYGEAKIEGHKFGTRWRWVSALSQPRYPQAIILGTHCIGRCVYPGVGLDVVEDGNISCPLLGVCLWFLGHPPLGLVTVLAELSWLML